MEYLIWPASRPFKTERYEGGGILGCEEYLIGGDNYGVIQACNRIDINCFLNWPTPASFSFIVGLFKQTTQFLQQINVKICHVHPVYSIVIQTHDLWNMSHLP